MGFLNEFGVEAARREKRFQRALLTLLAVLAAAGFLYFWFKNYREERRADEFLATLQRGDYAAAYAFWGCRVESPCPNYDHKSFLEDWGPSSSIGKLQSYRLVRSSERGSGVVVTVELNGQQRIRLWVEKKDGVLGFSPD